MNAITIFSLFWAFFVANLLGYGGGPPTIPLIQYEVVNVYGWMSLAEFGQLLAIANALPGPITTKMGGYIGFQVGGVWGSVIVLAATVVPSAYAMILLAKQRNRLRDNSYMKAVIRAVQPVVAALLLLLSWQFLTDAWFTEAYYHTLILLTVVLLALIRWKVAPVWVVLGAMGYGTVFMA